VADTELRGVDPEASLEEVIKTLNRLIRVLQGGTGGRLKVRGSDGGRRNIAGGATLATGEYAAEFQSDGGHHLIVYHSNGSGVRLFVDDNGLHVTSDFLHDGSGLGFFSHAVAGKQTVTGSKGGNAALGSLLGILALQYGLLNDSST
jgi:hypothetical protein